MTSNYGVKALQKQIYPNWDRLEIQNIITKLKRKYTLNTPGVNLNCCCTPGPIPIA